jgi:hypothetical protein
MSRFRTPNFTKILWTCNLTVPGLSPSSCAISLFAKPQATKCAISRSRGLKGVDHPSDIPKMTR